MVHLIVMKQGRDFNTLLVAIFSIASNKKPSLAQQALDRVMDPAKNPDEHIHRHAIRFRKKSVP